MIILAAKGKVSMIQWSFLVFVWLQPCNVGSYHLFSVCLCKVIKVISPDLSVFGCPFDPFQLHSKLISPVILRLASAHRYSFGFSGVSSSASVFLNFPHSFSSDKQQLIPWGPVGSCRSPWFFPGEVGEGYGGELRFEADTLQGLHFAGWDEI